MVKSQESRVASLYKYLFIVLFCGFSQSCKVGYSFTGGDIPAEAKTFSVAYFQTTASLAPPQLSQSFTEALRDLFLSQTRLKLIQTDGDLRFQGNIIGYEVSPVAVEGNEVAAKNRLKIRVSVIFENMIDPKKNFESTFERFYDFDNNQNITAVQGELIKQINDQLVQDIFNRSVGNW